MTAELLAVACIEQRRHSPLLLARLEDGQVGVSRQMFADILMLIVRHPRQSDWKMGSAGTDNDGRGAHA
jgi:hypothetical protein